MFKFISKSNRLKCQNRKQILKMNQNVQRQKIETQHLIVNVKTWNTTEIKPFEGKVKKGAANKRQKRDSKTWMRGAKWEGEEKMINKGAEDVTKRKAVTFAAFALGLLLIHIMGLLHRSMLACSPMWKTWVIYEVLEKLGWMAILKNIGQNLFEGHTAWVWMTASLSSFLLALDFAPSGWVPWGILRSTVLFRGSENVHLSHLAKDLHELFAFCYFKL